MRLSEISTRAGRGEGMDAWKLAEVRGNLYGLLLKVDVLAAGSTDMEIIQDRLQEALDYLDDIANV